MRPLVSDTDQELQPVELDLGVRQSMTVKTTITAQPRALGTADCTIGRF